MLYDYRQESWDFLIHTLYVPRLAPALLSTAPRYPIRVVAARVGVTEVTLRAWEGRHAAVAPARSKGGQRLFSDADVERLALLRALTAQGTPISALAPLATEALRCMVRAPATAPAVSDRGINGTAPSVARDLATCRRAVIALGAERLHQSLMRLALECGPLAFLEEVAAPLCAWIGDEWNQGRLTEAQERAASEVLRRVLGFLLQTLRREGRDHLVVLTTLSGERHEFGAMMAGIIAAQAGWSCHYLGADLPGVAIGAAVKRLQAKLVAVSIIAPHPASHPAEELVALRRAVGRQVHIVVGGPSSSVVSHVLAEARVTRLDTLRDWREHLVQQRDSTKSGGTR